MVKLKNLQNIERRFFKPKPFVKLAFVSDNNSPRNEGIEKARQNMTSRAQLIRFYG